MAGSRTAGDGRLLPFKFSAGRSGVRAVDKGLAMDYTIFAHNRAFDTLFAPPTPPCRRGGFFCNGTIGSAGGGTPSAFASSSG